MPTMSLGAKHCVFRDYICSSGSNLRGDKFGLHSVGGLSSKRVLVKKLCNVGHFHPSSVGCGGGHPDIVFAHLFLFGRRMKINRRCRNEIVLSGTLGGMSRVGLDCRRGVFDMRFTSSGCVLPRGARCTCGLRNFGRN